jgi:hypothetical protein
MNPQSIQDDRQPADHHGSPQNPPGQPHSVMYVHASIFRIRISYSETIPLIFIFPYIKVNHTTNNKRTYHTSCTIQYISCSMREEKNLARICLESSGNGYVLGRGAGGVPYPCQATFFGSYWNAGVPSILPRPTIQYSKLRGLRGIFVLSHRRSRCVWPVVI